VAEYCPNAAVPESGPNVRSRWGLVDKDDNWYLRAGTERGQRTFHVDRIGIIAAEPTDEAAERPDEFTLAAAWHKSSELAGKYDPVEQSTTSSLRPEEFTSPPE
jgi:predicted DNA-binding transcriptional regulator YafY